MKHKFVTHQNCEIQNCMICDGGLAVCEVCGGAENTLTKECHSFTVTIEDFDELSDEEKESASNGGWGKECANYIRVCHDGKTLLLESDAIEPEDKNFRRDLSWISVWLKKAYELGKADALG